MKLLVLTTLLGGALCEGGVTCEGVALVCVAFPPLVPFPIGATMGVAGALCDGATLASVDVCLLSTLSIWIMLYFKPSSRSSPCNCRLRNTPRMPSLS